jgi:hypothetical protein
MPKLIKNLGVYRCIDVCTKTAAANGSKPNWRSRYIDQIGTLSLYESERKFPGTPFFSFSNNIWYLRTVIITTQNSRYTFILK